MSQELLPEEVRRKVELMRFFADQMARLLDGIIPGGSGVASQWRELSANWATQGFWDAAELPLDALREC